jgi:predicted DNA-binding transcriptional regulator AlpA
VPSIPYDRAFPIEWHSRKFERSSERAWSAQQTDRSVAKAFQRLRIPSKVKHLEKEKVMDRVIRLNDVKRITGLSRTTIWEMERAGKFPKHLQLTAKAIGWLESQIVSWMEALTAPPPTEPERRPNIR